MMDDGLPLTVEIPNKVWCSTQKLLALEFGQYAYKVPAIPN